MKRIFLCKENEIKLATIKGKFLSTQFTCNHQFFLVVYTTILLRTNAVFPMLSSSRFTGNATSYLGFPTSGEHQIGKSYFGEGLVKFCLIPGCLNAITVRLAAEN